MAKDDGGNAFPQALDRQHGFVGADGMSLRDYFAGQWLVGSSQYWANSEPVKLAAEAYRIADAMIAERAKG